MRDKKTRPLAAAVDRPPPSVFLPLPKRSELRGNFIFSSSSHFHLFIFLRPCSLFL